MSFGNPKVWVSAFRRALVALAFGMIGVQDIPVVWGIVWNATFAFIAIIIISLLLDEAGFFKWIALHVARLADGNGKKLFSFIVLLGAVVSAFFANDGTALILTPIVIAILTALRFNPATTLAFIMAAGFIADTASIPLVVSNLVNIVSADFFDVPFDRYALVMPPVNVVSVLSSLAVLYLFYQKDIPKIYELSLVDTPNSAIVDKATFITGWWVLVALLVVFFVVEPFGVPISVIAGFGALVLSTLIQALAIDGANVANPITKEAMVFANVIGCDLGPKLTPIGSLATLLWLHVLASKNITVNWCYYFKVGVVLPRLWRWRCGYKFWHKF